ncbi:MAG: CCA tRNA nucleotidyltransferase [Chloroflexota bacterium]
MEGSLSVYLVGGPVRDALLGAPLKDLDFAVEGDAPAVARELADEVGGRVLTHPQFGTATLVLADCRVDLATARQELYPHPGALPQVAPGTISDDLARRDFSINSLALPLAEHHPQVLDPHGGVGDLEQGLVRTLHRNSFVDDATRIFRAVRYEQRLGFRIEGETLAQLQDATSRGYLATISGDRIRHELERIFHEERPDLALQRASQLGILAAVHPSLGYAFGVLPHFDPDRIGAPGEGTEPLAYLACLVYHLSPEEGESVAHRFNLPSSWAKVVRDAIQLQQRGAELATPGLSRSQVWRLVEGLAPAAVLAATHLSDSPLAAQRLEQYLKELRFIVPTLNGRDLLEIGVPPGPLMGQILDQLRAAKLDRQVSTDEEERLLVRKLLATQGG